MSLSVVSQCSLMWRYGLKPSLDISMDNGQTVQVSDCSKYLNIVTGCSPTDLSCHLFGNNSCYALR